MDIFVYISGAASIAALFISIYQVRRVSRVQSHVNYALEEFRERQKRVAFQELLTKSREFSKELTSIANRTSGRKYRGGIGRDLKNRIELFLGDMEEYHADLPPEAIATIRTIREMVKELDFDDIENNPEDVSKINDGFQIIRNELSTYLRG